MAESGFMAGSIVAKLLLDKTGFDQGLKDARTMMGTLAKTAADGSVPIGKLNMLMKEYGGKTMLDAQKEIRRLSGDQKSLDKAFAGGQITLGSYQKASKSVQAQLKELQGTTTVATTETKSLGSTLMGNLIPAFTLASLATMAIQKGLRALADAFTNSVKGAMLEQASEVALASALELTGRKAAGAKDSLMSFAQQQMKATIYTHEQVESVETLLAQLTKLDVEGIKRATKGAMGLAAVLGVDLDSAARMVTKAMEGNYVALARVGIKVDENLTGEEKQVALLNKLDVLYQRAIAQAGTYAGRLEQLKNWWGEIGSELGKAIVNNASVSDLMLNLKNRIIELIESGKLDEWATRLGDAVSLMLTPLGKMLDIMSAFGDVKGGGIAGWWFRELTGINKHKAAVAMANTALATTLQASLKIVKLNQRETKAALEDGGEGWDIYVARMKEIDAQLVKERKLPRVVIPGAEGLAQFTQDQKDLLKAQNALFSDDIIRKINVAKVTLEAYLKSPRSNESGIKNMKDYIKGMEDSLKTLNPVLSQAEQGVVEFGIDASALARNPAFDILSDSAKTLGAVVGGELGKAIDYVEPKYDGMFEGIIGWCARAKTKFSELTDSVKALVIGGTVEETTWKIEDLQEALLVPGLTLERIRELNVELAKLKGIRSESSGGWASFISKIAADFATLKTLIDPIIQQITMNSSIAIENEYKKRLAYINKTVKNEEAKQKAIMALEAEYEIKKTAAARRAATIAKAVALTSAIVNTAEAVTKALAQGGFIFGIPMAAIVGALGAIQVALIAAQPIPLAEGASFTKPTLLQNVLVGEKRPEYLLDKPKLTDIVRDALMMPRFMGAPAMAMAGAGGGGGTVTLNFNGPLVSSPGVSMRDLEAAGENLVVILDRQLKRVGRRL